MTELAHMTIDGLRICVRSKFQGNLSNTISAVAVESTQYPHYHK